MRRAALAFLVICFGVADAPAQTPANMTLTLLGPADAIDPDVMDAFSRESGVTVVYEEAGTPEAFDKSLADARGGIDLVLIPGHRADKMIRAGALRRLDAARIPNAKGLDPALIQKLGLIDPGQHFTIPYGWSPLGLAYNVAQVKARLDDASPDSWGVIFRAADIRRLADCGVQIADAPEEVLAAGLAFSRLPTDGRRSADLQRAAALVGAIRTQVRRFHASDHINALATGDTCMAAATAADAIQARARAVEAGNGVDIGFAIPKEGAPLAVDLLAIPKDARNPGRGAALHGFSAAPRQCRAQSGRDRTGHARRCGEGPTRSGGGRRPRPVPRCRDDETAVCRARLRRGQPAPRHPRMGAGENGTITICHPLSGASGQAPDAPRQNTAPSSSRPQRREEEDKSTEQSKARCLQSDRALSCLL